jgi:methionyl-tRNA formyltransferase
MRILIAATPEVAIPSIKALRQSEHSIVLATQPAKPAGRGLKMLPTPVSVEFPDAIQIQNEKELQNLLVGIDLLITIGYGRILSMETLIVPKFGGINLHFSLLPKWRGAAPVQRTIEAGDLNTGVTVFQMDAGMDTGPIWTQNVFPIVQETNAPKLFNQLSLIGADSLITAIKLIESGKSPTPQMGKASIAAKINKSEAAIDWSSSAEINLRKIKAFAFNPVCRGQFRSQIVKILDAERSNSSLEVGQINDAGEVGCGEGSIRLLTVLPAGKKAMSAKDWINGLKLKAGEKFEW